MAQVMARVGIEPDLAVAPGAVGVLGLKEKQGGRGTPYPLRRTLSPVEPALARS